MSRRAWVFRAPEVTSCWLRHDMARQETADPITALLLWLIYRGSGLPFTVTRTPIRQEIAA